MGMFDELFVWRCRIGIPEAGSEPVRQNVSYRHPIHIPRISERRARRRLKAFGLPSGRNWLVMTAQPRW